MLGLLSDAHGNLGGFLKGMALLERHGARRFAFLGDAVGYIPDWGVVDVLAARRDAFAFVMGNHEEALLSGELSSRDGIYQHQALRDTATPERTAFLRSWPRSTRLDLACGRILLVHGSPHDTQNGYLYPDTPLDAFDLDEAFLFCGHTHRPFVRDAGATRFVNIGSYGLPRDDGRYGSVALLDETRGDVQVLRYELEPETSTCLEKFAHLDPSVTNLFARRADNIFGKFDV